MSIREAQGIIFHDIFSFMKSYLETASPFNPLPSRLINDLSCAASGTLNQYFHYMDAHLIVKAITDGSCLRVDYFNHSAVTLTLVKEHPRHILHTVFN